MTNLHRAARSGENFGLCCDWAIIVSLSAAVFVLPASIALLDSFVAVAVVFYFIKKIGRTVIEWPLKAAQLDLPGKVRFIWGAFAPVENPLNGPLQFLTIAMLLSVVFSQYPKLSLMAFMGKFLKSVFVYFSFMEAFSSRKRIWVFVSVLLFSALIAIASGIVQHYTGKDFIRGRLIGTENFHSTGRISSAFLGANSFGAYLLPVIGLVAHTLYTLFTRKRSWACWGGTAFFLSLLLTCLCWTYSRSAWAGYLVLLLVMVCMDWRKMFYAGFLFLVFVFIFMPSLNGIRHESFITDNTQFHQKETSLGDVMQDSGSGRIIYWQKAISIIRSSPVWGTGLNTYTKIIKRDLNPDTWHYAHNCYLQLTAETGFLGLLSFLGVIGVLLRQGFVHNRQTGDFWSLTLLQGGVCGLCAFLVDAFFDNTFYTVQLGLLMWLIFGLTMALTRLKTE